MDLIEAADVSPRHRHPWELARLWVLRQLIARRVRLEAGSTVVDIGCGDGFVIGELARAFPDAHFYGIDAGFTPESAAERQKTLPSNVHLFHDLDAVPVKSAAALILLMDVLEHIQDDKAFLANMLARPIVGRATQLIVTVPAYQSLFSAHDVFLKHFRRYTNHQLRDRLEQAGLRVIDIGYFFASLLPLRVLTVIRERLSPPAAADATGLSEYGGGSMTTAVLSAVLKADAFGGLWLRRIGISVPGLSNYAICRTSA
jgi:trans-aconitate methyltransferase